MGWRSFLVRLRNLPSSSSFVAKLKEDEEYNSGKWWRDALDQSMGQEPMQIQRRVSIDEYLASGGFERSA